MVELLDDRGLIALNQDAAGHQATLATTAMTCKSS